MHVKRVPYRSRGRWPAVAAAGVVLVPVVLLGCGGPDIPPREARDAVSGFATEWSRGKAAQAVDPHTARTAATTVRDLNESLTITTTAVTPKGKLACLDDDQAESINAGRGVCRQNLAVTHELAGLGRWRYTTTAEVRENTEGGWAVWWTPETFHPKLTGTTRLERHRALPPRASILDRNGEPLTEERPVVRVGVIPGKAKPDMTYYELGRNLGIDAADLRKRADAASPKQFVDVLALREQAYDELSYVLDEIPGVTTRKATMSLAPTSSYARGVLGVMSPATDKMLKDAGPLAVIGDPVGVSGLQRAFEEQLAGRPGGSIDVVDVRNGKKLHEVYTLEPRPGKALLTTLDPFAQEAAEHVVEAQEKPTSIVAVRASTGEILAAANGPGVTSYNRAFVGEYPPGSTFKVVSVAALLENGLSMVESVECPAETNVGGKRFKNAHNMSLPNGPTWNAFAFSCNTTVVNRAENLADGDLVAMAQRFGIGAEWDLGLPAYSGSVPEPKDLVDRAATMIGQGRVLMSPLGMALVAAAVDSGQPRAPVLVPKVKPGGPVGEKLPTGLRTNLRELMRRVVESGSARSLDLIGEPVHAKTGTAEYGNESPPRTHAWMIGFRGDIAFAVVVEDGGGGGRDAGPVAQSFLQESRFVQ
ncbi:penicillin-binding transpeptidase domain-containing protein [Actinopolymorpha sp. B9G3]|uniref:penicillin-binding transpeptidase domain-containing protein n=1 Tax=Actinopolymorpha sp. B9G3 TaxID=3158970 RepID=UPI0032D8CC47